MPSFGPIVATCGASVPLAAVVARAWRTCMLVVWLLLLLLLLLQRHFEQDAKGWPSDERKDVKEEKGKAGTTSF